MDVKLGKELGCRRKAGWLDSVLMDAEEEGVKIIYKKTRAGAVDETLWPRTQPCDWHGPNCGETTENGVVVTVVGVVGVVVVVSVCGDADRERLRLDWRLGKVQGVRSGWTTELPTTGAHLGWTPPQPKARTGRSRRA